MTALRPAPRPRTGTPRTLLPRCACGSTDLIAVAPGAEAIVAPIAGTDGLAILLIRAVPARGWCLACWPCRPLPPADHAPASLTDRSPR